MRKYLFFLPGLFCLLSHQLVSAGNGDYATTFHENRMQELLSRIQNLQAANNVSGLVQLSNEVRTECSERKTIYYPVILEICLALNSSRNAGSELHETIRDLAVFAIDSPGEKPVEIIVKLLLFLQGDFEYAKGQLKGEQWVQERKKRVVRWLHGWKLIQKQISAFPKQVEPFSINVAPPVETGLPAGVTPRAIKDPILRKRYEEALEKNTKNANAYRKKREFEDLEKSFAGQAQRYIVEAFCKPPFRTEEMVVILKKYSVESESRIAMVEEVSRRVTSTIERDAKLAKALAASKAPEALPFKENPLSTDRRLRVAITVNMKKPKVEEILGLLCTKTGLPITVSTHIPKDRLAFWSVGFHNVPAYVVMEELNKAVVDQGHWQKQENGYRLAGELKPTLESLHEAQVKDRGVPPGRSGFAVVLTIVSLVVLAVLAVWAIIYRRKEKGQI